MKSALFSELAAAKGVLIQTFVIYLAIGGFVAIGTGSLMACLAAVGAMTPFLQLFTFAAYDSMNGWERFRTSLPTSRNALVVSRYVNILLSTLIMLILVFVLMLIVGAAAPALPLSPDVTAAFAEEVTNPIMLLSAGIAGTCFIMLIVALVMPFIMRFGMTKAMRIVPIVLCLLAPASVALMKNLPMPDMITNALLWVQDPANQTILLVSVIAMTLALYGISCFISTIVYRKKEL